MIEPTESSMPPVMMTKAWASENRPNRPIRLAVLDRLIGDRKRGLMMRDGGADDEDQEEEAQIFLQHCRSQSQLQASPTASCSTFAR